MKVSSVKKFDDYTKLNKAIDSCLTIEQLEVCWCMFINFCKLHKWFEHVNELKRDIRNRFDAKERTLFHNEGAYSLFKADSPRHQKRAAIAKMARDADNLRGSVT